MTHSLPADPKNEQQVENLQTALAELQQEHDRLNAKERKLRKFVEAEIDKLEEIRGFSFQGLALKLSASKSKAEKAEWDKYTHLRSRYDKCYADLADVIAAMHEIRQRMASVDDGKNQNKNALAGPAAISALQHVVQSGEKSISAIHKVKSTLLESKKVAWWRFIVDLVAKGNVDSATFRSRDLRLQRLIRQARRRINRFKSELQDVNRLLGWPMGISQFITGQKSYVNNFNDAQAEIRNLKHNNWKP
ncbi:MAG: hypothetical protein H8E15_07485 [Planctomycetes bacterium]|nr:hypothetical protein [Planctomycetota bacterium]